MQSAVYTGMGGICAYSPCVQHFILEIFSDLAKLKQFQRDYPYAYHLDFTDNIFPYFPYHMFIYYFSTNQFILFFDAFQSKL